MITGKTKVLAIFGSPIEQALSPIVHNAAFQADGLDAVMVGCDVGEERLAAAMAGARAMGMAGLGVTMPLKAAVIPHLDACEEKIEYLGAVNVVACKDGVYTGYNTDGDGFLMNLKRSGARPEGKTVFMFGAGGAGKGIAYALLEDGVKRLIVCNGSQARAMGMIESLSRRFPDRMEYLPLGDERTGALCRQADIIINTTSMGMGGSPSPHAEQIPWDELSKDTVIAEIIHKPLETELIRRAREKGFRTVTGDGMMLYQAALAYKLMMGREAPVEVMKAAIQARLEGENR